MLVPVGVPVSPPFVLADGGMPRGPATLLQDRATAATLSAFYTVHRELGSGFVQGVYQRAMALELAQRSLGVEQDVPLNVF
jgi:PD-(D/E)XK nuclease superfamily